MPTATAIICNKKGLHARAAAKVVKLANSYNAQLHVARLSRDGTTEEASAGATSILSLLMLAAENGVSVALHSEGPQAHEALEALIDLISRRFDEEE